MGKSEYGKQYLKERYYWLKEHHICVACGSEDAEKNSIYCLICKEDNKARQKERYHKKAKSKEYKKTEAERKRIAYYKAKEEKKCTKCGKQLTGDSVKTLCVKCSRKRGNYYEQVDGYDRSERPKYGKCYI